MPYSVTDEQDTPRTTPAVRGLIAINVAIFFLQLTVVNPNDMASGLGFQLRDLTTQPWTALSYMFVHQGVMHLAVNMYTLWVFGPRVERAWSPGNFASYYLWCGLGGWLLHTLVSGWLGQGGGVLIGASAAVFGVMLAYAMRWPDDEITIFPFVFISLKVKWLVWLLAAFNLAAGVASAGGSGTAYFAHLGGFAFGYLFLRKWSIGGIDRLRQRMSHVPDVPDETPRAVPRPQPRPRERERERGREIDEIVARSNALVTRQSPPPSAASLANRVGKQKAEELNDVLDKISKQGIESLTSDERRLLEELSRKLRG